MKDCGMVAMKCYYIMVVVGVCVAEEQNSICSKRKEVLLYYHQQDRSVETRLVTPAQEEDDTIRTPSFKEKE